MADASESGTSDSEATLSAVESTNSSPGHSAEDHQAPYATRSRVQALHQISQQQVGGIIRETREHLDVLSSNLTRPRTPVQNELNPGRLMIQLCRLYTTAFDVVRNRITEVMEDTLNQANRYLTDPDVIESSSSESSSPSAVSARVPRDSNETDRTPRRRRSILTEVLGAFLIWLLVLWIAIIFAYPELHMAAVGHMFHGTVENLYNVPIIILVCLLMYFS